MTVDHLNLKFLVCVDNLKFFDLRFSKAIVTPPPPPPQANMANQKRQFH